MELSLCLICCNGYQRDILAQPDVSDENVQKFCQVLVQAPVALDPNNKNLLSDTLANLGQVFKGTRTFLCGDCTQLVKEVGFQGSQKEEIEKQVNQLKEELKGKMERLKIVADVYSMMMEAIEKTIKESDEACLTNFLSVDSVSNRNGLLLMRQRMMDVAVSLRQSGKPNGPVSETSNATMTTTLASRTVQNQPDAPVGPQADIGEVFSSAPAFLVKEEVERNEYENGDNEADAFFSMELPGQIRSEEFLLPNPLAPNSFNLLNLNRVRNVGRPRTRPLPLFTGPRPRGRPRTKPLPLFKIKRPIGRPRVRPLVTIKRPIGRPRKNLLEPLVKIKRPVGRPRTKPLTTIPVPVEGIKMELPPVEKTKRPVGRPRKSAPPVFWKYEMSPVNGPNFKPELLPSKTRSGRDVQAENNAADFTSSPMMNGHFLAMESKPLEASQNQNLEETATGTSVQTPTPKRRGRPRKHPLPSPSGISMTAAIPHSSGSPPNQMVTPMSQSSHEFVGYPAVSDKSPVVETIPSGSDKSEGTGAPKGLTKSGQIFESNATPIPTLVTIPRVESVNNAGEQPVKRKPGRPRKSETRPKMFVAQRTNRLRSRSLISSDFSNHGRVQSEASPGMNACSSRDAMTNQNRNSSCVSTNETVSSSPNAIADQVGDVDINRTVNNLNSDLFDNSLFPFARTVPTNCETSSGSSHRPNVFSPVQMKKELCKTARSDSPSSTVFSNQDLASHPYQSFLDSVESILPV